MEQAIAFQKFKGTCINTPFEKMRARALISADMDARGISLINFNLTAFLHYDKRPGAYLILSLWASEPIRKQVNKFRAYPDEGKQALYKRVYMLGENLRHRKDLPKGFLDKAIIQMKQAVDNEIALLKNYAA